MAFFYLFPFLGCFRFDIDVIIRINVLNTRLKRREQNAKKTLVSPASSLFYFSWM